jgi:hypothetical protein
VTYGNQIQESWKAMPRSDSRPHGSSRNDGVWRDWIQTTPKPAHVRIHCSGGWIAIIAPGGIQYYVPRQCTIDILQKEQQKVIFRAGKVYYFAAAHCLSGADIDRHIGETNHVVIDVTGSAGKTALLGVVHAGRFLP